jgi:hypothetical protein
MQCPKCAAQIPDGEEYCRQCFTPVERPGWWRRFCDWLFERPVQYRVGGCSSVQWFGRIDPATGQSRTIDSLDNIPPEIRAQLEDLQRKAVTGVGEMSFKFRDFSGQEHEYKSLEEMPPEVRGLFEQVRKMALASAEKKQAAGLIDAGQGVEQVESGDRQQVESGE